jgi:hypothetical protein
VTIVIFIKNCFLIFLWQYYQRWLEKQAMVTKVVENQDTTSAKHQKQVAKLGVVNEHNLIPYNIRP